MPFPEPQFSIFSRLFLLAGKYQRPVSIHCVRAYGHLTTFFQSMSEKDGPLPTKIMLHSYSGSKDTLRMLYKIPRIKDILYVSVSWVVSCRTKSHPEWIISVPETRLLLESDHGNWELVDDDMHCVAQRVAEIRGWNMEECYQRCLKNSEEFFQGYTLNNK